ncbi:MAG TPA: hypothetical protein VJT83_08245 [Chitinophagaceae bacterium]|nr:hypothetical protein [Chitinophagaceae bacterium]
MKQSAIFYFLLVMIGACNNPVAKKKKDDKPNFVFKETLATGDTSIISYGQRRPLNIVYELSQQWEVKESENAQGIMLFKDSSVLFNPRNVMKMGKWKLGQNGDKLLLQLNFDDGSTREYVIVDRGNDRLTLVWQKDGRNLSMHLTSDAKVHANIFNDPFHPSNNKWRVRPSKPETDSAIHERVKQCVRFYALYLRDNIKKNRSTINFSGLPSCFRWYSGGLGLLDEDSLPYEWDQCFYSEKTRRREGKNYRKHLTDTISIGRRMRRPGSMNLKRCWSRCTIRCKKCSVQSTVYIVLSIQTKYSITFRFLMVVGIQIRFFRYCPMLCEHFALIR